ncbi:MAG: two-component sensor histidine kinase [Herminiimonas sp.]|nr:two-component sensor histidine kinase [Herminiimonas sp.]
MVHADWLTTILDGTPSEIYIAACDSLKVVELNRAARSNLQFDDDARMPLSLSDIARSIPLDNYRSLLQALDNGASSEVRLETTHVRRDGSTYPVALRLYRADAARPVYIAIGQDLSERQALARALLASEERFHAIVSNTPGLVYQFVMHADGGFAFPYLSDGCHALLGIGADALERDAARFMALILPEDRDSYVTAMMTSAADKSGWNWEGRIWIEAWKDIKWINLRATPRALADGSVQWEGIMTNITQSKLEEEEIKRSRAQLAELSAHVDQVKEQERTRIAREIHDDLGGNLTAIKMSLALLARRLPPEAQLGDKAEYLDSLVDRTIESVHRISGDLRPSILDFGLVAAIDWQATEFEKQTGIGCAFEANRKDIVLHPDQATALFRIFQEALTNISKHAQATQVRVELVRGTRNVRLQIADNGCGIATRDRMKPKSFGIRGMIERASALGGDLSVSSGPEGGSVVSVKVPLAAVRKSRAATARAAADSTPLAAATADIAGIVQ